MKRILISLALVLMMVVSLAACGAGGDAESSPSTSAANGAPEEELPSGKLAVVGSTSVSPVIESIVAKYSDVNPNLEIEIQAVGSSAGIEAAINGSADIGMASRDVKEEELAEGLVATEIALDGIAVIVNTENEASDLTTEQVQKIFKGEITNWKDVGGADAEITVISREEGSGTRSSFEELLDLVADDNSSLVSERALVQEGTGGVKAGVFGNPNAVGYISLGMMDDSVKAVSVDGVEATVENVLDKSYGVMRPFLVVTKGEPAGNVKVFLDYVLSDEAQVLVEEESYIPVNK
ncbi:MAG: phosphate ABC transporter substrate-binding protein PstS family protein [Christensenellales bacterium]|jgi:phosphate transport system substrate-binding protein